MILSAKCSDVWVLVQIWSLETHTGMAHSLEFSPDGKRVLGVIKWLSVVKWPYTTEYAVRIWDVGGGAEVRCRRLDRHRIAQCATMNSEVDSVCGELT